MINVGTILKVSDNSGARFAMCIKIYGSNNTKPVSIGSVILVSIKRAIPKERQINRINKRRKVIKGTIYKAVVVRVRKSIYRTTGERISFSDNAVVLLKDQDTLLCTRVFGPVSQELRKLGFSKLVSISAGVF
jgi:large subunit ribosomal protein L14